MGGNTMPQVRIKTWWVVTLAALSAVILAGVVAASVTPGVDWEYAFRPAARELLFTGNPYHIDGYLNAPWALIPLIPLALLPLNVGYGILTVIGLACFGYAAYKSGAKPLVLAAFILSPPVVHSLLNGNIDWMVLLGFVLPPQIGLLLVVIKPQMGWVVALFWLVEAFRNGGWREAIRVFWPVTVALCISFLLYGLWPLHFSRELTDWWNASLWPASIPVGLALLVASLRQRDMRYAMGASPCLAPYILLHSWSGALLAIIALPFESLAAIIGLWVLVLLRILGTPAF